MIGHRACFRENGDLPPWRGSAAKKKPPVFNARAPLTREIMRNAILGMTLTLSYENLSSFSLPKG